MKRKLKARRGASLAETLVAIIVLAILTSGGITAVSAAMANYLRMSEAANAEVLASTVIETIANEVRQGNNISVASSDDTLILDSQRWGTGAKITLDTTGRLAVTESGGAAVTSPLQLISEKTYAGLTLTDLAFAKVEKGKDVPGGATPPGGSPPITGREIFTVTFKVHSERYGDLWQGDSVTVAPMDW